MNASVDMAKQIIWSNNGLDFEDWRDDLENEFPDVPEDTLMQYMFDMNDEYLEDERMNLNILVGNPIIVIADIGRWNGRFSGYKMIESGNISDCLDDDTDCQTWYVDEDGELRCDATHHDGINHYWYRECIGSEEAIEALKEKLYEGTATDDDVKAATGTLGEYIKDVYGW